MKVLGAPGSKGWRRAFHSPWQGLLRAGPSSAGPWVGESGTRWDFPVCAHLSRGGAEQAASERLPLVTAPPECRAAQPQPAQVLCACGERQRCRVDCGRAGVSEAETAKDDRVCVGPDLSGVHPPGCGPGHPLTSPGHSCAPNPSHFRGEAGRKGVEGHKTDWNLEVTDWKKDVYVLFCPD